MFKTLVCILGALTVLIMTLLISLTVCGDTFGATNCAKSLCYILPFWAGFAVGFVYEGIYE